MLTVFTVLTAFLVASVVVVVQEQQQEEEHVRRVFSRRCQVDVVATRPERRD